MTLLQKLVEARIQFQEANLKKTGKNSFVGFEYFELADILPKINNLAKSLGFVCLVTFSADKATLTIQDTEKDEKIEFTSPLAEVKLKGAHEVQNLGAVQTYIRRYLYLMAFEIVECDTADNDMGNDKKLPPKKNPEKQPANNSGKLTPEQENIRNNILENIKKIIESVYANGDPIFSEQEKLEMRQQASVLPKSEESNKSLHEMLVFLERKREDRELTY